jgi:signal transduction histidine kinase
MSAAAARAAPVVLVDQGVQEVVAAEVQGAPVAEAVPAVAAVAAVRVAVNNMARYPNWKAGLAVFGILIVLLMVNFFWQTRRITRTFKEHSLAHSRILAAVVELNIKNSLVSMEGMETLIAGYLKNSAQFIRYLNDFDPFSSPELTAFASESGLAGIRISDESLPDVSGPEGWLPEPDALPLEMTGLQFVPEPHLYVYRLIDTSTRVSSRKSFIDVGMSALEVESLHKKMSVETLLSLLNRMTGIEYVRLSSRLPDNPSASGQETRLIQQDGRPISETRITMPDHILTVGLEADYFSSRIRTLKKEMIVFVTILILFGAASSVWLYRIQRHQLNKTRQFERKMARQMEQASLGRATATITHEIRNPLNAISMGLQRLQIETVDLAADHMALIESMRDAVSRTNAIISNLQQFVRPFTFDHQPVPAADLILSLMAPYRQACADRQIAIEPDLDCKLVLTGDRHLLGQAFDNFIKNAVEAQPDGGFLHIHLTRRGNRGIISFENRCDAMDQETEKMIFEPYFTTKTQGSGLGLAVSRKIIDAHAGSIHAGCLDNTFSIHVTLPLASEPSPST